MLVVQANPGVTGDVIVSANDQTLITQIAGQVMASANVGVGASAAQLDVGHGHGPVNHLWPLSGK